MKKNYIDKKNKIIIFEYKNDWIYGKRFFDDSVTLIIGVKSDKREVYATIKSENMDVEKKYYCTTQHFYSKNGLKNIEYNNDFVIKLLEEYEPANNLRKSNSGHLLNEKQFY